MKRRRIDPMMQLYFALAAAARDMASPAARRLAASKAQTIPRTWHERYNTRHRKFIAAARTFLRSLPDFPDDMLADAATDARRFADTVDAIARERRPIVRRGDEDEAA
jgi:hypothetical protein